MDPESTGINEALQVFFQASPDAMVLIDLEGTILDANPVFIKMAEHYQHQGIGENLFALMESQPTLRHLLANRRKMVRRALQTGQSVTFEDVQEAETMSITIYPVCDKNGVPNRFLIVKKDITPQKESEAKYRGINNNLQFILEKCHIGAWTMDFPSGKIHGTAEYGRIFGFNDNHHVCNFDHYLEHILPEDRPAYLQLARNVAAKWDLVYRIRRTDGAIRWIRDVGDFEYDPDNQPVRLMGILLDITEQKETEQKLYDLEHRLNFASFNSHIGLWSLDLQTLLLSRTEAHARIYGEDYSAKSSWTLQETSAHIFVDDRQRVASVVQQALRDHQDYQFEARICRSDGGIRWIRVNGVFQFDDQGKAQYILGITQDITGQKEQEFEKAELQAQLVQSQKMEVLGQLAGGIAHDINNALAIIQGNTELIQKAVGNQDPQSPLLNSVLGAVNRSSGMIKQLLAFARKAPISPSRIVLDDELRNMVNMMGKLIRENITLELDANCPDTCISADPSKLTQIFTNLIINARDAIAGIGRIRISTNLITGAEIKEKHPFIPNKERYVQLLVVDTGSGIPKQVLPHIFEPFFTTKGFGKGTGLGLSTVYGLVKQNNGFIFCDTAEGVGTTFEIYFPADECALSQEREPNTRCEAPVKGRILIVEDEPEIAHLLAMVLKQEGFQVFSNQTAEQGIDFINKSDVNIDLIISDVLLPGMNGILMSERIKASHPDMRFLFMSGYSVDVVEQFGLNNENPNFVAKPFSIDNLLEKVHAILNPSAS